MKVFKIGDSVTYYPEYGEPEKGVVKSLCDDPNYVFVVYNCNGEWHRYKDYTGCRTCVADLKSEWHENL